MTEQTEAAPSRIEPLTREQVAEFLRDWQVLEGTAAGRRDFRLKHLDQMIADCVAITE